MIKRKFKKKLDLLKPEIKIRWYTWEPQYYITVNEVKKLDPDDYKRLGIRACYNHNSYIIIGSPTRIKFDRIYLKHPRDLMCVEILGR